MGNDTADLEFAQIRKLDQFRIESQTSSIEVSRDILKTICSSIFYLRDCSDKFWTRPDVATVVKIYDGKRKLGLKYTDNPDGAELRLDEFVLCNNGYKLTGSLLLSDFDADQILKFVNTQ